MTGRLVEQTKLTFAERSAMFALLSAHFEGVTAARFEADLSEKNWAVLIERDHTLVGFSTIRAYEAIVDGERLSVIYSGDTIVSPDAWGASSFPRAWIQAVYQLRKLYSTGPLIWLLLTSGFRTYRFLPVFWQQFYPRFDQSPPARWRNIRDTLASERFGSRFNSATGLVQFQQPQRLRGMLQDVPSGRLDDPHVAYFLAKNPGYIDGDELVCVADLDPSCLTPAGRRVVYGAAR